MDKKHGDIEGDCEKFENEEQIARIIVPVSSIN
jgi:hypothetical protein